MNLAQYLKGPKQGNESGTDSKDVSPFLQARREEDDRVGSVITQRNAWMAATFLVGLIAVGAVAGLSWAATQSKFVPFVVEVDSTGQAAAVGVPTQIPIGKGVELATRATLHEWVVNYRQVSVDIALQKRAIYKVYHHIIPGDPAHRKANDFFQSETDNPMKRASKVTVDINVISVIQQTNNTYQVDWTETVRSRSGELQDNSPFRMRGIFTTAKFEHPDGTAEQKLWDNPLGIYIVDYNWQRLQ
jgi:type IV secretory pathway TrbF-like protein